MPSVEVWWTGRCPQIEVQDELRLFVEQLSKRSDAHWRRPQPKRPAFLEVLKQQRAQNQPKLPDVRTFDSQITGHILVGMDVADDRQDFVAEAARLGLTLDKASPEAKPALLGLDRLGVRGMDFRLFDPRGLYPSEDRISFVFLSSEVAPFLNGRIGLVVDRGMCALYDSELVRNADWYVRGPFVHLRYYLEEWMDRLLAWVKFFFIPELRYWRHEHLPGYEQARNEFQDLVTRSSLEVAKSDTFTALLDSFEREVRDWTLQVESW